MKSVNILHDFVTFEQACELQKLGLQFNCIGYYLKEEVLGLGKEKDFKFLDRPKERFVGPASTTLVIAPTFKQVFNYFAERYQLFGETAFYVIDDSNSQYDGCQAFKYIIKDTQNYKEKVLFQEQEFPTQYKADIALLNKLIQIVKLW